MGCLVSTANGDRRITIRVSHKSFMQDIVVDTKRNEHLNLMAYQKFVMSKVTQRYPVPAGSTLQMFIGAEDPIVFSDDDPCRQILGWAATADIYTWLYEPGVYDEANLHLFGRILPPAVHL